MDGAHPDDDAGMGGAFGMNFMAPFGPGGMGLGKSLTASCERPGGLPTCHVASLNVVNGVLATSSHSAPSLYPVALHTLLALYAYPVSICYSVCALNHSCRILCVVGYSKRNHMAATRHMALMSWVWH